MAWVRAPRQSLLDYAGCHDVFPRAERGQLGRTVTCLPFPANAITHDRGFNCCKRTVEALGRELGRLDHAETRQKSPL